MERWQMIFVTCTSLAVFMFIIFIYANHLYKKRRQNAIFQWTPVEQRWGLMWDPAKPFGLLGAPITVARLRGIVDEVSVAVLYDIISTKHGSHEYTEYRAGFTKPVPMGMEVGSETILGRGLVESVKKAMGAEDIQCGDPEFDKTVFVKASDETGMRRVLSFPGVRQRIMELVTRHEGWIHWEKGAAIREKELNEDSDVVNERIEMLVSTLSAIQKAFLGQDVPVSSSTRIGHEGFPGGDGFPGMEIKIKL